MRTRRRSPSWKRLHPAVAVALCLLAGGCVTGKPIAGADPSDASARVPAASYRSAVSGYESGRPVEPAPWREQNERITPPPKQ